MTNTRFLFESTQEASRSLSISSDSARQQLLLHLADLLTTAIPRILEANEKDLSKMDPQDSKFDRLVLNHDRLAQQIDAIRSIASLPDPLGQVILERQHANGLHIQKVTVPLGVIGVIYESRPNVTLDVASLCLRSGNACILKGGKEAWESNQAMVTVLKQALVYFQMPTACVTLLPPDRSVVDDLLKATEFVDLIIPRGSHGLIQHVRQNTLIPTIETGAGVCHTFVEAKADVNMAVQIIVNARVSRPSVCNSLDTILVDGTVWPDLAPILLPELEKHQVRLKADALSFPLIQTLGYPDIALAQASDFGMEWLSLTLSIRIVSGLEQALQHIREHSSKHSEAIITQDPEIAEQFLQQVDAAAVYHNASTRFTDGGEMGLGAEMGISTQKLHARGPFALEKLVTEKWIGRGTGQVRW